MTDQRPDLGDLLEQPDPTFESVLSCVFGIQDHEVRTYVALLETPGSTVEELASEMDRDRSNVNRSLSTLLDSGLADRNRRLLDAGGYVYQYTATDLPDAKDLLHDALDEWTDTVHDVIDEFDGD
ncbi:TrmB family transcriptional regulator [Halorubellus sp. JP-L1]|uniref:helix-turn-helix domain-containing protein n=1 Tax=Halorubellus sp. JP-L1 TaxID=2715753 RepID=UPI001409DB4C|nr:helix-turn-helix domain-containing protein [Halorubellus sp. JP-L1]NHN43341.1 TrmB family transcriptional regulator [Halorubellus sp. JP-L1]